jgi:predicted aspartyl protease
MGFARAKFKVSGNRDYIEGIAIVDTGSLLSIIDESVAEKLGLKSTGRVVKLTTLSGEEVECNEMLTRTFEVEGERIVSERVAVCKLPNNIREKLRTMGVYDGLIIGVVTLETAGFAVNPLTGKIEKVGWLAL